MTPDLVQLVAAVAPGDAVTGQAFAWRDVLSSAGIRSEIHAQHIHPDLTDVVRPLSAAPRDGVPILLRYSIWSDAAAIALRADSRLGVVYHNITPAHLVRPLDPTLAELCARGRDMLPAFRARVTTAVADSSYNADELVRAGWEVPTVIPLLIDLPVPPPARDEVMPTMLFVGRVVPSKRVDDLIRVLAYVREHRIPDASLDIIGAAADLASYTRELDALIAALGVRDAVRFRGRVSDAERDHAYDTAGAYVSMSAHEGFCAPLLEAMSRGLPVVARGAGAVPETTGGAALLVDGPDIALAGDAVAEVLTNAATRRGLHANATRRLAELDRAVLEPRILDAVAPLFAP